jgi:glucokinase
MHDGQRLFAGIDVGGTKINGILATATGKVVAQKSIATGAGADPDLSIVRIAKLAQMLADEVAVSPIALGVGMPGCVDKATGKVIFLPNMSNRWSNYPVGSALADILRVPVVLANDARMATLGEYTFGLNACVSDLLMVTIGTGIGGGMILDGRLRLGSYGAAGELGHHVIQSNGPRCSCGGRGCLEALVSGPLLEADGAELVRSLSAPILSHLVNGSPEKVTTREMAIAAREGDSEVARAIRVRAEYLGIGIANAISITAVNYVVLAGGVSALDELLLEPVRTTVEQNVRMFPPAEIRIARTTLGQNTGALGCVAFAAAQFA